MRHSEFVTDEICDRFRVLGNVELTIVKLREVEVIGVYQFNIYPMAQGQEETLEAYGRDILPAFNGVAARTGPTGVVSNRLSVLRSVPAA